jgi:hypothetical protein
MGNAPGRQDDKKQPRFTSVEVRLARIKAIYTAREKG